MVKIVFSTLAFVYAAAIASTLLMLLVIDRADSAEPHVVAPEIQRPAPTVEPGRVTLTFEPTAQRLDRG